MRKSELVLSVALFGSAALCTWLMVELIAERTRNTELSAQVAQPAALPRPALEHAVNSTAEATAAAPPAVVRSPPSESATPTSSRTVMSKQPDWETYQRGLMRDPKYREAWRQQQRLALALRRDNAIRLLEVSSAQADAIIDLSIERDLRRYDDTPPDPMTEEYRQQQQAQEAAEELAYQDRVRELLREDKRAQWQSYMESRASRMQVDQFRTRLSGVDALRDDQVEPLIAALHVERAQMRQELLEYRETQSWDGDASDSQRRYGERQIELMKAAHGRMHSAAGAILTGTQLETLDALLRREVERQEALARMTRLQSKLEQSTESVAN
jgi:hypothetical protein